jgi:hypothetical protein
VTGIIDVWDIETYDAELLTMLAAERQLLIDYFRTGDEIDTEYAASKLMPRRDNPHASAFYRLVDRISHAMEARTIRGWHYSRLTPDEIEQIEREGLVPSSIEGLRARLDRRVASGDFTVAQADRIFAGSPFHAQAESRGGKLYMVANPEPHDYDGLADILRHWGGESTYFWQRDPEILALLKATGRAAIIEIAMPIAASTHSAAAGMAAIHRFARSLGCACETKDFELYATHPLPASAVLNIHLEDDSSFQRIARGYPDRYSDDDG